MIEILTWVAIISGGLLILLMLLSIIGGIDLDLDVDIGSTDIDTDSGGLGVVKGFLTFISVSSWVVKILLATNNHPFVALGIGLFAGVVAFYILHYLLKLMLRGQENVNWSINDSLYQRGTVYLKIPAQAGEGIVQINVNGAMREFKARSFENDEIETGATVIVVDIDGEFVLVKKSEDLI